MKHIRTALHTVAAAAVVSVAACAVNPATGQRQLMLIGEGREIEMGREYDGQIEAAYGLYENADWQGLVDRMGQEMAASSERPQLPWSFEVIDDPIVNAFALPGGFIYVSRGILAHLNSEAELAGVLGHEIGHVTARHSVAQMSRQQFQMLGLIGGALLWDRLRDNLGVASAAVQVLNLSYGRGDETQSDELGVRYMTRAGYDARELPDVFRTLALVSGDPEDRLPEWQSTHPAPENREARIEELLAEQGVDYSGYRVAEDEYLRRLEGMPFGSNPREGFFSGALFRHPELEFRLRFPEGWRTQNERNRVIAVTEDQQAAIILTLAQEGSPETAADAFEASEAVTSFRRRAADFNGLDGVRLDFAYDDGQERLRGEVAFVSHGGTVYQLLAFGTVDRWTSVRAAASDALDSFARETDREVLAVQPWTIEVVRVPRAMTGAQFTERWPSMVDAAVIHRINRTTPTERLQAGRLMKRVVGEPRPR